MDGSDEVDKDAAERNNWGACTRRGMMQVEGKQRARRSTPRQAGLQRVQAWLCSNTEEAQKEWLAHGVFIVPPARVEEKKVNSAKSN